MSNLQEKIKEILLLSDDDADLLLNGDFKGLMSQNKEAVVRIGIVYGGVLAGVLLYLALFSVFGAMGRLVLTALFFGLTGGAAFVYRKDALALLKYPVFSYFFIGVFALVALSMFSEISAQGSFFSKLLTLLVIGGAIGGAYTLREKMAEFGVSKLQIAGSILAVSALFMSLQAAGIQFVVDSEIAMAQRRSEARRSRDAEQMRRNQASMKMCSSEEECRKMNTKKNSYYAQYEDIAQELCEIAVSKEMPGRFEWSVSAKDYKFNRYEVDVLKDEISLFGDRAYLIGNDSSRTKVVYTCRYNTKKKTSLAAVQKAK